MFNLNFFNFSVYACSVEQIPVPRFNCKHTILFQFFKVPLDYSMIKC